MKEELVMKKNMAILLTALTLAFPPAMAANATVSEASVIDETSYTKYQDIDYTGSLGEKLKIHVQSTEDEAEMLLTFDFYGDKASVKVSRTDDGRFVVTDGGFFATDGAEVAELSVENSNWKLI